jgi:curved DNA-binding protein CbpA
MQIALKWHPDRHTNPEVKAQAEPIFKRATQAKEELIAMLGAGAE